MNKQLLTCHPISLSTGRTGRRKSPQTRWLHFEWTRSRNAKRREVAHHSTMKQSEYSYAPDSVPVFRHCCSCLIARIHCHKELHVLYHEKRLIRLPGRVSRKEREERDNRALRSDCSNYVRGHTTDLPHRSRVHGVNQHQRHDLVSFDIVDRESDCLKQVLFVTLERKSVRESSNDADSLPCSSHSPSLLTHGTCTRPSRTSFDAQRTLLPHQIRVYLLFS